MGREDDLSDAELAYLESGGKATDGLPAPEPAADTPAPEASAEPAKAEAPNDDDGLTDDESDAEVEVVVGKDGKQRLKGKDGKFVSHKALHSEREKRKLAQQERDDLRIKLARGEERLAILNEAFNGNAQPAAAKAQQAPNPLDEEPIDPAKDFMGAVAQTQRQQKAIRDLVASQQQQTQQRDTMSSVKQVYHSDAQAFMKSEPNFEPAYRHLVAQRSKELELMGVADEGKRMQMIAQEETNLVVEALRNKQSPSQMLYQFALARGYQPKSANPSTNGLAPNGNAAAAKIAQVKAGQAAADTLSNAGGHSSEGLTFSALASMNDDEFAVAFDRLSKAQQEKFLGRA
jgi:hypothetical protein